MRTQVKSCQVEMDSNKDPYQAFGEIKDLKFHSRSKIAQIFDNLNPRARE